MKNLEIKKSKNIDNLIYRHNISEEYSIYKAYKTPSDNKVRAWEYCKQLCRDNNGHNLKVIGHSCHVFSAAFTFTKNGCNYIVHITPSHNYCYKIQEEI